VLNSAALYELTFTITTKTICRYHVEKVLSDVPTADRAKIILMMLDELPITVKERNIDAKTAAIYRILLLDLSKQSKTSKTEGQ
jgi:hypothetical protein